MTYFELFMFFFRISAVTFGGGIVILGMVQIEQEKRKDIPPHVFNDMTSLAATMPGPIAISIAWLIGRYYKGLRGAFVSVLGAILPPFVIVLFLSPFIIKYATIPAVSGFFKGVLVATAAIITTVVWQNVKGTIEMGLHGILPFAAVTAMIGAFHIHPLLSMAIIIVLQIAAEKIAYK